VSPREQVAAGRKPGAPVAVVAAVADRQPVVPVVAAAVADRRPAVRVGLAAEQAAGAGMQPGEPAVAAAYKQLSAPKLAAALQGAVEGVLAAEPVPVDAAAERTLCRLLAGAAAH
jgi:hypothetical protein